jgi:hypothetical protein
MLIAPPPVCPYCASYMLVITRNSCTASTDGTLATVLTPL